jgi:hypothetical protein
MINSCLRSLWLIVVDQSLHLRLQALMQPMENLDGQDGPPSDFYLSTPEFSTPPRNRAAAGDPFLASKLYFFFHSTMNR